MSRCVKMTFSIKGPDEAFFDNIQKHAKSHRIEGFAMIDSATTVKIIACGNSADLDIFLDKIDEIMVRYASQDVEIDPFLKDKDYRGVFRIML